MTSLGLTFEYAVGTESGPDVLERVALGFERLGVEASKWGSYLFPHLVPIFEQAVDAQFAAQGAGTTGAWAPLSPAYAREKAKRWPGQPILVATGKLKAALTQSDASGALRVTTPTTLSFGTLGVEYASFHQLGTARMPARPEIDFGPGPVAAVREAAQNAVREMVQAAKLEALLEEDSRAELRDWEGPLTKKQASAAKGRATRRKKAIAQARAIRAKREGKS